MRQPLVLLGQQPFALAHQLRQQRAELVIGLAPGLVETALEAFRTSGFQKPLIAVEKILTSAITIGTGGSAGAEGPIVQIGAAISSGVGQVFQVARQHMPILIACGAAAGCRSRSR